MSHRRFVQVGKLVAIKQNVPLPPAGGSWDSGVTEKETFVYKFRLHALNLENLPFLVDMSPD